MARLIQLTEDGSHTVMLPEANITYHSRHGAIQESMHVFINGGLRWLTGKHETLRIFEVGFGTGLNALLAFRGALVTKQPMHYTAVELHPLQENEYRLLNYCKVLDDDALQQYFIQMHASPWGQEAVIHQLFTLAKINAPLAGAVIETTFNCIFFDAFAPDDQPELWTKEIFDKMFAILENRGILVTYCSKGTVRRALAEAGFMVQKLPGPPGKREMVRAMKLVE